MRSHRGGPHGEGRVEGEVVQHFQPGQGFVHLEDRDGRRSQGTAMVLVGMGGMDED